MAGFGVFRKTNDPITTAGIGDGSGKVGSARC
jgi:hypothetical protein